MAALAQRGTTGPIRPHIFGPDGTRTGLNIPVAPAFPLLDESIQVFWVQEHPAQRCPLACSFLWAERREFHGRHEPGDYVIAQRPVAQRKIRGGLMKVQQPGQDGWSPTQARALDCHWNAPCLRRVSEVSEIGRFVSLFPPAPE